jgi:hypothetical protein
MRFTQKALPAPGMQPLVMQLALTLPLVVAVIAPPVRAGEADMEAPGVVAPIIITTTTGALSIPILRKVL